MIIKPLSINISAIFFLFLIASCGNEPSVQQNKGLKSSLPNTPELVSKAWQEAMDKNDFERVAELSTARTKVWLEENKSIFLNDNQSYQTDFVKLVCKEKGANAVCNYVIKEEGELIEDYYVLVNQDGQWLMDLEEEEALLDDQIFQEMAKELKLKE